METKNKLIQDLSFIKVASLGKSFGTAGFNRIKVYESFEKLCKKQDFLFLKLDDTYVPFRVVKWKQGDSMVRFDDVVSQDQADRFNGVGVFLPDDAAGHLEVNTEMPFVGYTILNLEEKIGDIIEIYEMPQQLLALVEYNSKEIYIPLHEDLIVEVNDEEEYLVMDLPEGILEL